jgi:glycerophosphoryl diester phosphodiesterase
MAAWSVLVWAAGLLVVTPLSAFVLGRMLGRDGVISNEEILSWVVTPAGIGFALLWLASALTLLVAQFGGLSRLVAYRGHAATLPLAAIALVTALPAVFRFCLVVAAAVLALLVPLLAWVAVVYRRLLREHDINYYLSARPPEWDRALALVLPAVVVWVIVLVWLLVRALPALPAFFDGHRPARTALAVGWRLSRGQFATLFTRLGAAVVVLTVVRGALAGTTFLLASAVVDAIARESTSLQPVLIATAAFTAFTGVLDLIVTFLGVAWLSALLTRFYLAEIRQADGPPNADPATTWLTRRRIVLVTAAGVALNAAATFAALEITSEPPEFLVIAHRAGALHAPENTLLALERAIESGADMAEIDVQRTKDGVVVVIHDADLMRVARDPRAIAGTDYAAFASVRQGRDDGSPPDERRLARLDEFLERASGRIGLAVELKYYGWDPLLAPQVLSEIRARGLEQQVMIISLSLRAIEQVRRLEPEIATGYLSSVSLGSLNRLPVTALALSRQRSSAPVIREAQAQGLEVYVWTVNDTGGMIEMIGRGADGIITDDPIVAARVRDELKTLTSIELLLLRFSDALTDEEANDEIPGVQ